MSAHQAVVLTSQIAAVAVLVSSFELFWLRKHLGDEGILSWPVLKTIHPWTVGPGARLLDPLLSLPRYYYVLAARAAAAAALIVAPTHTVLVSIAIAVIFFATLLMHLRSPYGLDGSDQLVFIIFGALLLGRIVAPDSQAATTAVLWFIAAQATLAYTTAGVAKLVSPIWRSGTAILRIFNAESYSNQRLASWLRTHPGAGKWLAWGVILPELLFPLGLIFGSPVLWVFLAWAAGFHLLTAILMGLNGFIPAFFAAFPAIVFCAAQAETMLPV